MPGKPPAIFVYTDIGGFKLFTVIGRRFHSSRMWGRVNWWIVPDISTDHSAFKTSGTVHGHSITSLKNRIVCWYIIV